MRLNFFPILSKTLPPQVLPLSALNQTWENTAGFDLISVTQNLNLSPRTDILSSKGLVLAPRASTSSTRFFFSARKYVESSSHLFNWNKAIRFAWCGAIAYGIYCGIKVLMKADLQKASPEREEDPNAEISPYYRTPTPSTPRQKRERDREGILSEWVDRKGDPQAEDHWRIKIGVPPRKPIPRPIPADSPIEND